MSTDSQRCAALTKAGTQCRLTAQAGSSYCHVHQDLAKAPAAAETPEERQFRELVAELNDLAADLQRMVDGYSPPPFTPQGMIALLKQNMHRFSPQMRLEIVRELSENLEGASPRDLLDPDTWKGMWYLLNYSIQNQSESVRDNITARLRQLPGGDALADLQGMLEGARPRDFLEIETWKGMWFLLNYTLQNQAKEMRQRLLGEPEDEAS